MSKMLSTLSKPVDEFVAMNSLRVAVFLSRASNIASEVVGKTVLVLVAVGLAGLLLWGAVALYAAMPLKLIVVVGIIAIVIAVRRVN